MIYANNDIHPIFPYAPNIPLYIQYSPIYPIFPSTPNIPLYVLAVLAGKRKFIILEVRDALGPFF